MSKKYQGQVAVCSRTFSCHPILRAETLEAFANVRFNDAGEKLSGSSLISFLHDCDGAIVALEKVDSSILAELPHLNVISKYGVGLDNIDIDALSEHHVELGWSGGVNRRSVSELTLGMMLALIRKIYQHHDVLRNHVWKNLQGAQLSEKTVGIIGCGYIGQDLVKLLKPFNCNIIINDILDKSELCSEQSIKQTSKEEVFEQADVLSLHVPLTSETHQLINADVLKKMKPQSILINTSRGNVVDEEALHHSLKHGEIAGAALDVFANEPLGPSPLLSLENFIATPHIGGSSQEGVLAMGRSAITHLKKLLVGRGL